MAKYNYSTNTTKENTAKAVGVGLPISTKQSIEVCNFIRGRELGVTKALLNEVIKGKIAVPFKRFNSVGHKRGNMASGRYPKKCSQNILDLLESAESNAQFKGLNTASLIITHISAQKAGNQWRYGRQRRRKAKRTTIEVLLEEKVIAPKKTQKEKKKVEEKKPVEKKVEEKVKAPKDNTKKKPTASPKKEVTKEKIKND